MPYANSRLSIEFCKFLETFLYTVLYKFSIYPRNLFNREHRFGGLVWACKNALVQNYVKKLAQSFYEPLCNQEISDIAIPIFEKNIASSRSITSSIPPICCIFLLKFDKIWNTTNSVALELLKTFPSVDVFDEVVNFNHDCSKYRQCFSEDTALITQCFYGTFKKIEKLQLRSSTLSSSRNLTFQIYLNYYIKAYSENRDACDKSLAPQQEVKQITGATTANHYRSVCNGWIPALCLRTQQLNDDSTPETQTHNIMSKEVNSEVTERIPLPQFIAAIRGGYSTEKKLPEGCSLMEILFFETDNTSTNNDND